jgi:hypothetical protein
VTLRRHDQTGTIGSNAAPAIERENMMKFLVEFGSADTRDVILEEHFVF